MPVPPHRGPRCGAEATRQRAAALRPHMTLLVSLRATALALLPALLAAQTEPAPPAAQVPTLEELAKKVDAAHGVAAAATPIQTFAATMLMQQLARAQQQRVDAELEVKFAEWQRPDGGQWNLLRYRVLDAANRIEQGRDRKDYWGLVDGKAVPLSGKEHGKDLADCRRYLALAQQLVKFLAPGKVLTGLRNPGPVTAETLRIGRADPVACFTVAGDLDSFPLRRQAGETAAARVQAYVDSTTGLLVALRVLPLGADGKPGRSGEFLRLLDHAPQRGMQVPMTIVHFDIEDVGPPQPQLKIQLTTLQLGAALKPEDFDRPR